MRPLEGQHTAALIRALRDAEVEYVIVGGVAATAHGSTHMTWDLDVLVPFSRANWARLIAALHPFAPVFHGHSGRIPLHTSPEAMIPFRMVLLETTLGRIDVLKEIPVGTYEQLSPRCLTVELFGGPVRILNLDDLIESKARLMRDKDKPVVIELRAMRERLRAP